VPRKPKPVILTGGQLIEREQRARLDVVEERKRLAIDEAQAHAAIRHGCLQRMVTSADVTVQDAFETTAAGNLVPRKISELPREVARAIKKLKVFTTTTEKDGVKTTIQSTEVEMAHHLNYDELIGKYVGLWSDKTASNHLHLHNHQAPQGAKLSELTPEQLAARRAQLEAEVKKLDAEEGEKP
jgi:hypothetical protein